MKNIRIKLTFVVMVAGIILASSQINRKYWSELAPVYIKGVLFLTPSESDGIRLPSLPNPFLNEKTILGIDENKNGIRDDLDLWVADYGKNYNERMALREVLKSEQKLLIYAYDNDIESYQKETRLLYLRNSCLNNLIRMYRKDQLFYLIENLAYLARNTSERISISKNVVASGYEYGPPAGVVVRLGHEYLVCNFKLQNLNLIIEDAKRN